MYVTNRVYSAEVTSSKLGVDVASNWEATCREALEIYGGPHGVSHFYRSVVTPGGYRGSRVIGHLIVSGRRRERLEGGVR